MIDAPTDAGADGGPSPKPPVLLDGGAPDAGPAPVVLPTSGCFERDVVLAEVRSEDGRRVGVSATGILARDDGWLVAVSDTDSEPRVVLLGLDGQERASAVASIRTLVDAGSAYIGFGSSWFYRIDADDDGVRVGLPLRRTVYSVPGSSARVEPGLFRTFHIDEAGVANVRDLVPSAAERGGLTRVAARVDTPRGLGNLRLDQYAVVEDRVFVMGSGDYRSPTRLVQLQLGRVHDASLVPTTVLDDVRWEAGGPFVVGSASYRPRLVGITSDRRWALLSHERGGYVAELAPVPPHDAPGLRFEGYATALLQSPGRLGVLTQSGLSIFDDETLELLVEHQLTGGTVRAAMYAGRAALLFAESDGTVAQVRLRCFPI